MSLYISHVAGLTRHKRYSTLQRRSSMLSLHMPQFEISDELINLTDKLPKGTFLITSLAKINKRVGEKGFSESDYTQAVELLPDLNFNVTEENLPVKPDLHYVDTQKFLSSLIDRFGLLGHLDKLEIWFNVEYLLEQDKTIGKFIECVGCIKEVVDLTKATSPDLDTQQVIVDSLTDIYGKSEGIFNLGKLLKLLGLPHSGYISEDIDRISSDEAKLALMAMRTGIKTTLLEYKSSVNLLTDSLSDTDKKIEGVKQSLMKIKALLPVLKLLEKTMKSWDDTHIGVVKALSS